MAAIPRETTQTAERHSGALMKSSGHGLARGIYLHPQALISLCGLGGEGDGNLELLPVNHKTPDICWFLQKHSAQVLTKRLPELLKTTPVSEYLPLQIMPL